MRVAIRRLGIADLLLLIAAVAVGIGATRAYNDASDDGEFGQDGYWNYIRPAFDRAAPVESAFGLACWTLSQTALAVTCAAAGLLVIRLRRPRPAWSRLMRQPGAAACMATVVGAALGPVRNGVNRAAWSLKAPQFMTFGATRVGVPWRGGAMWFRPTEIAVFVLGWWLCLVATRVMRREPSSIDRLGRLVGYYWLALLALQSIAQDSL